MDLASRAATATPGSANPFVALADEIRNLTPAHNAPRWFRVQTYIFWAGFLLVGILNLSAIIAPLVRGKNARRKHMWLVHVKRVGTRRAYFVPNGRLVGSITGLAYGIVGSYELGVSIFNPDAENDAAYCIYFIFLFVQMWLTAFDALFADALCAVWRRGTAERPSWGDRLRHPHVLNTICWVVPVFGVATITTFIAIACHRWTLLTDARDNLLAVLNAAATAFDQGSPVDVAAITAATTRATAVAASSANFDRIAASVCCGVFGLALFVYVTSLALLIRTVLESKRSLKLATSGATTSALNASVATNPCVAGETWSAPSAWSKGPSPQPVAPIRTAPHKFVGRDGTQKRWHMLAAFLGINVAVLAWFCGSLIFIAISLDGLLNDFGLYRRALVVMFWPVWILGIVTGVLGLMRVCDGLRARAEPVSDSSLPRTPRRSPGPASYVGLFADVRDDLSLAEGEERPVGGAGVFPIELGGEAGVKAG